MIPSPAWSMILLKNFNIKDFPTFFTFYFFVRLQQNLTICGINNYYFTSSTVGQISKNLMFKIFIKINYPENIYFKATYVRAFFVQDRQTKFLIITINFNVLKAIIKS